MTQIDKMIDFTGSGLISSLENFTDTNHSREKVHLFDVSGRHWLHCHNSSSLYIISSLLFSSDKRYRCVVDWNVRLNVTAEKNIFLGVEYFFFNKISIFLDQWLNHELYNVIISLFITKFQIWGQWWYTGLCSYSAYRVFKNCMALMIMISEIMYFLLPCHNNNWIKNETPTNLDLDLIKIWTIRTFRALNPHQWSLVGWSIVKI